MVWELSLAGSVASVKLKKTGMLKAEWIKSEGIQFGGN